LGGEKKRRNLAPKNGSQRTEKTSFFKRAPEWNVLTNRAISSHSAWCGGRENVEAAFTAGLGNENWGTMVNREGKKAFAGQVFSSGK